MNILLIKPVSRRRLDGAWVTYQCPACGHTTDIKTEDTFDPPNISCIMCGHEEKDET